MSIANRGSRNTQLSTLTVGLVLLVAAAGLASLAFGSRDIGFGEVLDALGGGVDSDNATVITTQRLPRTLIGLLAGGALGVAGALMQGHTRNPLADPGLFGVNAGASFAVALLVFALGVTSPAAIVLAALTGAATVSALVFALGLGNLRGGALVMLAILGTTLSALLSALTTALILLDKQTLDVMRFWDVGSLQARDVSLAWMLVPLMILGIVLALVNGFALTTLGLGDDVARTLGTDVRTSRITGVVAITLLAGSATAWCGPIAFLGLVAPHAARAFCKHDYRWLVPTAGLIGAALLVAADTAGRVVARPGELQVGLVVAAVGAPLLLALTRRRRLVAL